MSNLLRRMLPTKGKTIELIEVTLIRPNPYQPRRIFDEYEMNCLAESIRSIGLLQPITVRRVDNCYQLVSGERRFRACRMAGMRQIPAIVQDFDDKTTALMALTENLQRRDLTLFEEAEAILALIREFGLTQLEAAQRLGLAQSTLSNKLRLLTLTAEQRERIIAAGLTERHARALLKLESADQRSHALDKIIADQMTVSDTDRYISDLLAPHTDFSAPPRRVALVGDVRLFINSLTKTVDHMRMAGLDAKSYKKETEDYIEYTVKIPKRRGSA